MKEHYNWVAILCGVIGSTIIGYHFGSGYVGAGVYLCILAVANWNKKL